jgi:hypothetical protein
MEDQVRIRITWMPVRYDEAPRIGHGFPILFYQSLTTFQPGTGQAQDETGIGRSYKGCYRKKDPTLFAQDYIHCLSRHPRFMFDDESPL